MIRSGSRPRSQVTAGKLPECRTLWMRSAEKVNWFTSLCDRGRRMAEMDAKLHSRS